MWNTLYCMNVALSKCDTDTFLSVSILPIFLFSYDQCAHACYRNDSVSPFLMRLQIHLTSWFFSYLFYCYHLQRHPLKHKTCFSLEWDKRMVTEILTYMTSFERDSYHFLMFKYKKKKKDPTKTKMCSSGRMFQNLAVVP